MTSSGHGSSDIERLAAVAAALRPEVGDLSERVVSRVFAQVPALAGDADMRREALRSTAASVHRFLDLVADPARRVDDEIPPDVLALGTALLRRGLQPAALVHGFLVGQNELWRVWLEEVGRLGAGEELLGVLAISSDRLTAWTDHLVSELMRRWQDERERWVGGALARRIELVQALLAGEGPAEPVASRALGYQLGPFVTAAALWDAGDVEDPAAALEALEAGAAALAAAAGVARALTVPVGVTTLWAWVATPAAPDTRAIAATLATACPPGRGIALGGPGEGLEGFRRSHDEARHARRVAEQGGRHGVVRYEDVEAVSLLSEDPARLARFVRRRLGPLAADDPAAARTRETLLVWLEEGGNARLAAERLFTHKNTVLYRLQRARRLLGRSPDEDRLALWLALAAMDRLGPGVAALDQGARTNRERRFGRAPLARTGPGS